MRHPEWLHELEINFQSVSKVLFSSLKPDEELSISLAAERSTFVRVNSAKIRQNTFVEQAFVSLSLQNGKQSYKASFPLYFQRDADENRALQFLQLAREQMVVADPDPFQVPFTDNGTSRDVFTGELLNDSEVFNAILAPAKGSDIAGLYASGPVVAASCNSKGQNHWFATESFFFDYSIFDGPRAVKGTYAGLKWNYEEYERSLSESKNQLSLLGRPIQKISKGNYRTYLAPSAVAEAVFTMGWGALSQAAAKRGGSAFKKLIDGEKSLSPLFTLRENFKMGTTARFNCRGEVSADLVPLIEKGRLVQLLISSRTAKEYKLQSNGAEEMEMPRAPEIAPGTLAKSDILRKLDTGLYLSNLHYLNWSDMLSARITGMTRYACFWVEKGEIVGPIQDLRFDESLYRLFGSELEAVTQFQEMQPNVSTYGERSLGGMLAPGMLIKDFTFTL